MKKEYTNGEVTVIWQPDLCIHSGICFRGLGQVFDPRKRPWVNLQGADTSLIVEQVQRCPSGALSYRMNEPGDQSSETQVSTVVEVLPNGPLLVYGTVQVKDHHGNETLKNKTTAFCRCGASANKPYCDGSHVRVGFKDEQG
jgi:uncharacterized Fe-S cluster protein YjdI